MVTQISGAIEVNPSRLHEFGASVAAEVHRHVRPQATRLNLVFADGVTFGQGNPSADLSAAITAYRECLTGMSAQMEALVETVGTIADAAEQIASRYASSDALAAAKAKDVLSALDAAAALQAALVTGTPRTGPQ